MSDFNPARKVEICLQPELRNFRIDFWMVKSGRGLRMNDLDYWLFDRSLTIPIDSFDDWRVGRLIRLWLSQDESFHTELYEHLRVKHVELKELK